MNDKKSLEEHIRKYSNQIYPFHMPGHKQLSKYMINDIEKIDVTEVESTDNLHNPIGIIKDAQKTASNIYKTKETFFLVNGSSCGILAAISSTVKFQDHILIARNCHKSVYNGIVINRLNPIYIYPQIINEYGIFGGVLPQDVDNILKSNGKISCVVITSPTYEGFTSNIKEIADIVHKYNKILIVDEAHGAHFIFSDAFPKSALEEGADIVIQSVHKTLPSYTQTALLHVNSSRVNIDNIKEQLSIYQTSSPSYIFMSAIDNCIRNVSKKGFFDTYIKHIISVRKKLSKLCTMKLLDTELINKYGIYDIDISKLVMVIKNGKLKPYDVEKELRDNYNIQIEMSSENHIIALSSVADNNEALNYLCNSLNKIDEKNEIVNNDSIKYDIIKDIVIKYSPSIAKDNEIEKIDLNKSIGRISGQFITQYPPGIPLVVPGEELNENILIHINKMIKNNINILGIEENKIKVIK